MSREEFTQGLKEGKWAFWQVLWVVVPLMLFLAAGAYFLGWFGEAAQVAKEQFGPRASLKKYEWFIDQAKSIDKMDKDIEIYQKRLSAVEEKYAAYGDDKAKWQPHIQVMYNKEQSQARDDLASVISHRNNLVKEYNAASSKFNWSPFESRSDMPSTHYEVMQR